MSISLSRRPSRRKRQKSALAGSFLTFLIVLIIYYGHGWSSLPASMLAGQALVNPSSPYLVEQARFWRSIHHIILNNDPQCQKFPDMVVPDKLDISFQNDHVHRRPDVLWVDDADVLRLKEAHQNFLNDILAASINFVYQKGTRGIVTTVADTQIPILLIQLRMLRATRSLLPVEVFLSKPTPYTNYICDNVLPAFNATCMYYSHVFAAAGTTIAIESNQYKTLAIVFSSFDELLLLDSDSWPIANPDHLFIYPPFIDIGLILWPDFWYASESPYYFSIAKIDHPPPLHTKPATSSGQLMYAKSKHSTSIMLAAYYNHYGPQYYHVLQSQGAPGQSDKESFGLAALALKEHVYSVKTMVTALGRMDSSARFFGSAMVQYDPIVDYQQRDALAIPPPKPAADVHDDNQQDLPGVPPRESIPPKTTHKPLFIHANVPKFDPRSVLGVFDMGGGFKTSPAVDTNGTHVRCWGGTAETAVERFGYDVERRFWDVIRTVACEDLMPVGGGGGGGGGGGKEDVAAGEVCRDITEHVRVVFG